MLQKAHQKIVHFFQDKLGDPGKQRRYNGDVKDKGKNGHGC